MKKNKVAIDVISLGHPENIPKLTAMINAVNSSNNSHILEIGDSFMNVTDAMLSSVIIQEEAGDVPMAADAAPG